MSGGGGFLAHFEGRGEGDDHTLGAFDIAANIQKRQRWRRLPLLVGERVPTGEDVVPGGHCLGVLFHFSLESVLCVDTKPPQGTGELGDLDAAYQARRRNAGEPSDGSIGMAGAPILDEVADSLLELRIANRRDVLSQDDVNFRTRLGVNQMGSAGCNGGVDPWVGHWALSVEQLLGGERHSLSDLGDVSCPAAHEVLEFL